MFWFLSLYHLGPLVINHVLLGQAQELKSSKFRRGQCLLVTCAINKQQTTTNNKHCGGHVEINFRPLASQATTSREAGYATDSTNNWRLCSNHVSSSSKWQLFKCSAFQIKKMYTCLHVHQQRYM